MTSSASSAAPDWVALADGRLHRLRRGRDYTGDVKTHIRAARAVAADLGRHVVISRDDLGNASFLWVQFLDGMAPEPGACPGCGQDALKLLGPSLARCDSCGRSFAVRAESSADLAGPEIDDSAARQQAVLSLRRAGLLAPGADVGSMLRDGGFVQVAGEVAAARATGVDLARLWTLWQAANIAVRREAGTLSVGSELSGGVFLGAAVRYLGAPAVRCFVVRHHRFEQHPHLAEPGRLEAIHGYLADQGVEFLDGLDAALAPGLAFGVVHLDHASGEELGADLRAVCELVVGGGVVVVEDVRLGAGGTGAARASAVESFLEDHPAFVPWHQPTGQLVLVRAGATA